LLVDYPGSQTSFPDGRKPNSHGLDMKQIIILKMHYYFAAQIRINTPEEYQKYIDKADQVFKKFKGKYLAVDNHPEVVEGSWNYTRTILIEFESKSDFEEWYYSPEYQEILKFRLQAADCDTILIEGY
jgi:uncharacterized protein (DUF1330 family)